MDTFDVMNIFFIGCFHLSVVIRKHFTEKLSGNYDNESLCKNAMKLRLL